jgi:hypothetical protein
MNRDEANQVARIIRGIFEYEETIDPRTIASMFEYMARLCDPFWLDELPTSACCSAHAGSYEECKE